MYAPCFFFLFKLSVHDALSSLLFDPAVSLLQSTSSVWIDPLLIKMLSLILHVECLKGFYKSVANNSKCNECPANSKSNTGRTGCLCNDGFYKESGLHVAPCKGKYRYYTQDILWVQFIFGSIIY